MLARASKNMGAAVCNGMGNLSSHAPPEHKTLIIITGPSGCGKSTLLEKLFARYPNRLVDNLYYCGASTSAFFSKFKLPLHTQNDQYNII